MRRSWQGKRRWLDVSDFRRRRSLVPRSNSEAVGDDQTGGLALSPYVPFSRTVIVRLSEPGSEVCFAVAFTCVPSFRSKKRGTPRSDLRSISPRIGPHRCVANIVCGEPLAHAWHPLPRL